MQGSGPHGRIIARDIDAAKAGKGMRAPGAAPAAAAAMPPPATPSDAQIRALYQDGSYDFVPHDQMRKIIAQRLTLSKQTIPHFYLTLDCDIGKLLAAREEINAAAPGKDGKPAYKISVNDFVIKALALALQRVPDANVTWTEAGMLHHHHSDIGVAVAIPGGLITPVVRNAETKSLSTISNEMKDYAARARTRHLKPQEYQGGSTAISNLGMYGIKDFAAVINPPHATILAVGAGEERAVVRNGQLAVANMMTRDAVDRPPRGRRRARRRTDEGVQDTDRKSGDDGGVMADTSFDVIIIGSGPGGYVTAIRAAQLGFKTAIVERDYLGGICLNWGCIPTKALLRSAEIYHYMQHAKDYGLKADNVSYDPAAVVKRSRGVAKRLNDGVSFLMKKNKVSIVWGEASIDAPGKVTVKASKSEAPKGALGAGAYQAKHIIIATGARPRVLPGFEPDKKLVWTYFEAMVPPSIPKSLLVVGSGAIGIEFASFFRTLGSEVTVVEVLPQILPVEDHEIQTFARKSFEKQGIKIHTSAKVTKLDKKADSVVATIEAAGKTQTLEVERVISAVGVTGNIENLGLEKLGVKTERGCVVVDAVQQDQRAGHLRYRRRVRPADARAQGRARRGRLYRGDQGPASAPDEQTDDPRLHVLYAADRLRWPHRTGREGQEGRHPRRPLSFRRQRQGDRAR